MVTRMTPSQLRTKLQQHGSQQRQAINRYNQQVRQHNQRVAQNVRDINSAISRYNREVQTHNNRVRSQQQRLRSETSRLNAHSTTRHVQFRQSVVRLSAAYDRLDQWSTGAAPTPQENFFADLSEREAANTVGVFNALDANDQDVAGSEEHESASDLQQTRIVDEIAVVSEELDSRWRGALFSLHPRNPEAARHFCTSVREIFTQVLEMKAPDTSVFRRASR